MRASNSVVAMVAVALSPDECERYDRQLRVPAIGRAGQLRLLNVVNVSNLRREMPHTTDRVGIAKVESAEPSIRAINAHVQVVERDRACPVCSVRRS